MAKSYGGAHSGLSQLNSEAPSQHMYCISHVVKHVTMDTF